MFWYGANGVEVVLPEPYQELADRLWDEIIAACDAYFLRGATAWAGDPRAPEFSDDVVERQFEYYDRYRQDAGAMHWGENREKTLAYDFTALPLEMKRAVCERQWVLSHEAGLDTDPVFLQSVERAHKFSPPEERGRVSAA